MIYEMRIYTLYHGKVPEMMKLFEEALPMRGKHSKLTGYWYTEIGELNRLVNMWEYKDLAHRSQVRQAVGKDLEFQKAVAKMNSLVMKGENMILISLQRGGDR